MKDLNGIGLPEEAECRLWFRQQIRTYGMSWMANWARSMSKVMEIAQEVIKEEGAKL